MIDLHCHMLPGVDDGAATLAEALGLARAAVDDGITHALATPHVHIGRYDNDRDRLADAFGNLRRALIKERIPLRLGLAAEVRLTDDIPRLVEEEQLPFIGEWQGDWVLLLELPHSHIPPGVEQVFAWLARRNIRVLIAHPERNRDILRDFKQVLPLVRSDCLLQVTAGAVAGHFGAGAERRARELLTRDMVTVLATDAHHLQRRPPVLAAGRIAAEATVGESRSWDLVQYNPASLAAAHFDFPICMHSAAVAEYS
ncbi:tyrosine-protein phosphatase [Microbulbifer hainanensis]|uniref:tyrosine-protein phosphatase n=1 Tax=Microbulbifer hainanensis TaxID=2735675 RepID=UPI001866B174|nr:CpsB/CapC family capsule biosynthesis tyrosine phosphatase [Microbulbifer hainanensis]